MRKHTAYKSAMWTDAHTTSKHIVRARWCLQFHEARSHFLQHVDAITHNPFTDNTSFNPLSHASRATRITHLVVEWYAHVSLNEQKEHDRAYTHIVT
jgi:hypothetical protein